MAVEALMEGIVSAAKSPVLSMIGRLHRALISQRRVRILASLISDRIPYGAHVLDVGCGDRMIDRLIVERRRDILIRGIDVRARPGAQVEVTTFDGAAIPFPDSSFDVVMFVDVLHHTDDPMVLLKEAARVARSAIVIKDHGMDGVLAYATLRLMDWVGNAHVGVALPYNYWREQRWHDAFKALGLRVDAWLASLRLYPWPFSMVFDRRLHFLARVVPSGAAAGSDNSLGPP